MRISEIVATTELVKRGEVYSQLSVEALQGFVVDVEGVPIIHGHNPLLLPLGKSERAWVDQYSETEASLHQEMYIVTEEPERFIHEASKTHCVHIRFADSPSKFHFGESDLGRSATVDMSAVGKGSYEILIQEISAYDEGIAFGFHDRQQEIPIPLVKFISDLSVAETLMIAIKVSIIGSAISGRLGRWIEETTKWIKNECVPVLKMYVID